MMTTFHGTLSNPRFQNKQNSSESLNMEHPLSTSNCRSLYFCVNKKPVSLEIDPKSQVPVVSGTSIAMQVPEANSVIIPAYWALGFKRATVQNGEGSASVYRDPDLRNCMKPYAGLTACIFGDNFSGQKSTVKYLWSSGASMYVHNHPWNFPMASHTQVQRTRKDRLVDLQSRQLQKKSWGNHWQSAPERNSWSAPWFSISLPRP